MIEKNCKDNLIIENFLIFLLVCSFVVVESGKLIYVLRVVNYGNI